MSGLVTGATAGPFESLSCIASSTVGLLAAAGFTQMTPVQAATIPQLLGHKDVAVEAVTGSGKTLAFVVPILEILSRNRPATRFDVAAIILSPTRELALQISQVVEQFASAGGEGVAADVPSDEDDEDEDVDLARPARPLSMILLTGGTDMAASIAQFRSTGGNIVTATPGRFEDMLKKLPELPGLLKKLEVLILDEADRLLDLGFEHSINHILGFLPKQRRTGLFSATQTKEVAALIRAGLRNPVKISVRVENKRKAGGTGDRDSIFRAIPASLQVHYTILPADEKLGMLVEFIKRQNAKTTSKFIVYFLTCACVDYFGKVLKALLDDVPMLTLHGKVPAKSRTAVFKRFSNLASGVLLCTDVAARGLDIPDVEWVVQYDPPQNPESFVHRCGRTARNGKDGNALVLLDPHEESYIEFLSIRNVPLVEMPKLEGIESPIEAVRKLSVADRDLYDKGRIAFVSYMRGYKEHQCSFIFQPSRLNLGRLATGFGLPHLPRMPELRGVDSSATFTPHPINHEKIPYHDKAREMKRRVEVKAKREADKIRDATPKPVKGKKDTNVSWSKKIEKKDKRDKRAVKKEAKKRVKADAAAAAEDEDWDADELAAEARLFKRFKSGKISKQEYYTLTSDAL